MGEGGTAPTPEPCPIRFPRAICGDLGQAERREWWIANGRAAYAGGTIAGSLTRRYHGLLIAPVASPLGRRLILAKADTTLRAGARSWPLFTNRWKSGAVAPAGFVRIAGFHLDCSVPVWTYEIERSPGGGAHLDGARRPYDLCGMAPAAGAGAPEKGFSLRVTLLANNRDHHGTTPAGGFDPEHSRGWRQSCRDGCAGSFP